MSARYQLIAFAIFILQVAGWSSYVPAQSRNEIHGQVCSGVRTSVATDSRPIAGVVVEAFGADGKVVATAVTRTDAKGRFSIVVPVEVRAYHLIVYDRDANYWIFKPKGEQINDRHPMDLGKILLYPRNTHLTASEALEQFEGAQFIRSFDKPAGDLAMRSLTSEYPEAAKAYQQHMVQIQREQMAEAQEKIDANKAAIEAANKRFGQLGDYNILDEVTVYFSNGEVKVDPKYTTQLLALAQKAHTLNGYVIQIKGYSSAIGSASLNQKLSEDRANNVTNILVQQGHIPLTRVLAPGAMGESHQVGNDKTAEGQVENRRVVVRILQNKGIAGN